jgi:hypothetical protein
MIAPLVGIQAFSYHIYCDLNSTGQPSIPWVCSLYEGVLMDMRMQDLKNLGMAGFLTGVLQSCVL